MTPRTIGPTARNAWSVDDGRVSLVRQTRPPVPVVVDALPTPIELDLARAALVVVDLQNDFCHQDGWLASIGVDVTGATDAVTVLAAELPVLRAAGAPVVWLNWGTFPTRRNLPPNALHVYDPDGRDVGIGSSEPTGHPVLQRGSWGASVVDELLAVAGPDDTWVAKHRMSGFWDTELDSVLRNLDVDTLLFAGVNADQCVLATLIDAACAGYDVVLLEDAAATTSPGFCWDATVYNVRQCFGFTTALGAVTAAIRGRAPTPTVTVPVDTVGAFVGAPAVLATGTSGGPLTGTTLGVKDLFDVAGTVTRAGNPDFAATRPPAAVHATAVRRLVEGGATVVGRTVTDELAFSLSGTNVHDGTPHNVAAPGRVPGGSSAGSAAAVAAGLVDLALGTDTGGSVRVPASYCGVFGWRSTHGSVPIDGVVPLAASFDSVGLFARDASLLVDAAGILLAAAAPTAAPRRVVVAAEGLAAVDHAVADEVCRVAALLGGVPEPTTLGVDLDEALHAFRTRQLWEAWAAHGAWIRDVHPRFGPGIEARFTAASKVDPGQLGPADVVRREVAEAVHAATADGTIVLMPAAAGAAPPIGVAGDTHDDTRMRTLRLTCAAGLAGAPVVVLPFGHVDGLPLGIAAIGAPGDDLGLLAWAAEPAIASLAAGLGARR